MHLAVKKGIFVNILLRNHSALIIVIYISSIISALKYLCELSDRRYSAWFMQ